jgi:hypothetical protein
LDCIAFAGFLWFYHAHILPQSNRKRKPNFKVAHYRIFCCLADGLIISSAVPGGFTKPVDQAALLDAVGKVLY